MKHNAAQLIQDYLVYFARKSADCPLTETKVFTSTESLIILA